MEIACLILCIVVLVFSAIVGRLQIIGVEQSNFALRPPNRARSPCISLSGNVITQNKENIR